MSVIFFLAFFSLFHFVVPYTPEELEGFFNKCLPFECGKLGKISIPFTSKSSPALCGPFVVDNCDKEQQIIQLERPKGRWYEVINISQSNTMFITDKKFQKQLDSKQCQSFNNLSLPSFLYAPLGIKPNITLFKCNPTANLTPDHHFDFSHTECKNFSIYTNISTTTPISLPNCTSVQLPLNINPGHKNIFDLLTASFTLEVYHWWPECYWCQLGGGKCQQNRENKYLCSDKNGEEIPPECFRCRLTGGNCRYNSRKKRVCVYKNGTEILLPGERTKPRGAWKITLLLGFGCPAILIISMLIIVFRNPRYIRKSSSIFCWTNTKDNRSIEVFLKNNGFITPKRYKYSEVKKMTSSFNNKLGQGGYGSVFKGKLSNGNLVAVKVLKESKKNGEEFTNEVASISRTSHVNIVTLLGFCCEGSKRALIYEFMCNGSLEKYIYQETPLKDERQLGWDTLYQIAIGIARGLEYLHRGCNTRILHFDIKPHNILLDENFIPKISDFGLSKICSKKVSIVSMLDARGTAGYIAPEVFCRSFGGVSHKSDVYSYGMLVLEMVGGRRNLCVTVDNTSEIYFPHWVFKRLEQGDDLGLHGIGNEESNQIARKLVLVSLWSIQTDPSNRPPISRVIEMLQGNPESIPIPPKPYLSSPPRSPQRSQASYSSLNISLL